MRKTRLIALGVAGALLAAAALTTLPGFASTPASQSVNVPNTAGKTKTITWKGTIPQGSNPNNDCNLGVNEDRHTINIAGSGYQNTVASFTFSISWKPPAAEDVADEILTVLAPGGSEVGASDTSGTTETVSGNNLNGKYIAIACGFANAAPQDYTGKLVIKTTSKKADRSLPSARPLGLKFSASIPSDLQRDEGEPLMEVDKAGRMYTCGPTGFSNASDYAQVSTDGGDQFHLMGTPPRGQQGTGGGGDCALATSPQANATEVDDQKTYNYAYSGLGPLANFTTATSPDGGHSLESSPDNGSIPGVDRQWLTFLDKNTVLMNYNRQAPRSVEVIKSTNGGLTYDPPNVPNSETTPTSVSFPGPLKTLPAKLNWTGQNNGRVAFFPWTGSLSSGGNAVNLAVSTDAGTTWKLCLAQKTTGDPSNSFPVADSDSAGNIYLTYSEDSKFHTYVTALKYSNLKKCMQPSGTQPTANPGFKTPIQVDRGKVRTSLFPWLVADGKPGRVAVMFAGTQSDGNPNTSAFKASWDIYVSQSLNALDSHAKYAQVKATTHPFHYDSICLNGLGCDVSGGDRSLADFFAIDYNPKTKGIGLVYVRANKKPGEAAGHIATPMVTRQIGGPSLGGGTVHVSGRKTLRQSSTDQTGDALSGYSSLVTTPTTQNEKAADVTHVHVGKAVNPKTGKASKGGGFTLTAKIADLSDTALQNELLDTQGKSLVWIWRFSNGYQDGGASARWNPAQGFTFGFNNYSVPAKGECGPSDGDKCVVYPGDKAIDGAVNQKKGTIKLTVPLKYLKALKGSEGDGQRPDQVPAKPGSRLYDGSLFTAANDVSPVQNVQSWLYPLDNSPAMDFRIPATIKSPLVKSKVSDKTPVRGAREKITAKLLACTRYPGDKAKLRGTKVDFEKQLKNGSWKTFAHKRVNKRCHAAVHFRARFKKRKFRARWPKQVKGYKSGKSHVRTVRTHRR